MRTLATRFRLPDHDELTAKAGAALSAGNSADSGLPLHLVYTSGYPSSILDRPDHAALARNSPSLIIGDMFSLLRIGERFGKLTDVASTKRLIREDFINWGEQVYFIMFALNAEHYIAETAFGLCCFHAHHN
jgi:hypothetical protein